LEDTGAIKGENELALIEELRELNEKIKMAVSIHVDAVARTNMVRSKAVIKLFRLAGRAPEPIVYEFEADVL
jgi:hypothetical protein